MWLAMVLWNPAMIMALESSPDLEYRAIQLEEPLSWERARALRDFALNFPDDQRAPLAYWEYLSLREFGFDSFNSTNIPRSWPEREAEWIFFTKTWPQYQSDWRVPFQRARNELGNFFPQVGPKGDIARASRFLDQAMRLAGEQTTHKWLSDNDISPDYAGWPDGPVWPIIKYHQALIYEYLVFRENAVDYIGLATTHFEDVLNTQPLYSVSEQDAAMFEDAETRLYRLRRMAEEPRPVQVHQETFDRLAALEIALHNESFKQSFSSDDLVLAVSKWSCSSETPVWLITIGRLLFESSSVNLIDRMYYAVHRGSGRLSSVR